MHQAPRNVVFQLQGAEESPVPHSPGHFCSSQTRFLPSASLGTGVAALAMLDFDVIA